MTSNCPHFSQHLKTWVSVRFWKCGQIGLSAPRNRTPKSRSDVADSFEKGNCPQHLKFGSWLGFGSGFKLKPLHPTPKKWVPVRCGRWTIQVPLFSTPQIWVSVRFWKCDPTTKNLGLGSVLEMGPHFAQHLSLVSSGSVLDVRTNNPNLFQHRKIRVSVRFWK